MCEVGKMEQSRERAGVSSLSPRSRSHVLLYISLPIESRQPYAVLVDKLEQRFGSFRQQNRWLSRFESRRRSPNESIAALADDLRQMSHKAYLNLNALAQEALSINQLC